MQSETVSRLSSNDSTCHLGKGINFLFWHLISWNISLLSSQSKYYICTFYPTLFPMHVWFLKKMPCPVKWSSHRIREGACDLQLILWQALVGSKIVVKNQSCCLCFCCSFQMAGTEFLKTMARGRNISDERAAADINQALATTRLVKTIDGKNTNILSV